MFGMFSYPKESGKEVKDLDKEVKADKENNKQEPIGYKGLYVIETDTNQQDWSKDPDIHGLYFSSYGPGPVNKVAIKLWDFFNKHNEDCEDENNHDGSQTGENECYQGFATYGFGSIALSLMVNEVEPNDRRTMEALYKKKLLQKALKLQGIKTTGMKKDEMIATMQKLIAKPKEVNEAETAGKRKSPETDQTTSSSNKKLAVSSTEA